MACAPGATAIEISLRCRAMASVLQEGRTSPAPFPSAGQMAPKDVGRTRPLVVWRERSRPAPCPAAGDLVFLPDASLVLEPDFYQFAARLFCGDFVHEITEVFLKSAVASTSCA